MVPITNDFVSNLLELGECLNSTAFRHNLEMLEIKAEPEFGYVLVRGTNNGVEMFRATRWQAIGKTDIKIAPQVAATTTGASNK